MLKNREQNRRRRMDQSWIQQTVMRRQVQKLAQTFIFFLNFRQVIFMLLELLCMKFYSVIFHSLEMLTSLVSLFFYYWHLIGKTCWIIVFRRKKRVVSGI